MEDDLGQLLPIVNEWFENSAEWRLGASLVVVGYKGRSDDNEISDEALDVPRTEWEENCSDDNIDWAVSREGICTFAE